tara:strand:- start:6208 stop:6351 length:144 start_codon:yes stop_codon:yes gene_type:complete
MSGEKQGYREAMDRMVRRMVDHGAKPDHAVKKAREAAIRKDKKDSKK